LVQNAQEKLKAIEGVRVLGPKNLSANILSFVLKGIHPSDVGALLNEQGIAARVGHHCCQPLMKRLGIAGTVRASFSVYNNQEDVERLVAGVKKAKELFQ
jgi:cysteine desulfurase/selenocysteine lyase